MRGYVLYVSSPVLSLALFTYVCTYVDNGTPWHGQPLRSHALNSGMFGTVRICTLVTVVGRQSAIVNSIFARMVVDGWSRWESYICSIPIIL